MSMSAKLNNSQNPVITRKKELEKEATMKTRVRDSADDLWWAMSSNVIGHHVGFLMWEQNHERSEHVSGLL